MAKKSQGTGGKPPASDSGAETGGNGLGGLVQSFQDGDQFYFTKFETLNDSGVSGGALLIVNDGNTPNDPFDDTLTVVIAATGLEPNQVHLQHIHGEDGTQAVTPPPSADTDGDGFIELAEGLPFYGGILLNLTSPQGSGLEGFPTAPSGSIFFSETYHLHTDQGDTDHGGHAAGDVINDFADLQEYEIVLHGMSVGAVGAGTPGEVDGTAEYKLVLPVASGVIQPLDDGQGASALAHLRNAFDGHGSNGDWFL
ncbi:hypothetical protein [Falsiroseomonas sp. E2-1-a20]|uniref:hypothetical protein n=1 Tax=Falsiroseomonas sp. E2-1-a20 TaxID=3239300 RepID=UPI003F2A6648